MQPNNSVIEGPKYAMVASKDFHGGEYKSTPRHGIRAFGRSLFAWAYDPSVSSRTRVVANGVLRCILSVLSRTSVHDERSVSIYLPPCESCIEDDFVRYSTAESFFIEQSESYWLQFWDANDLLALLETWQRGDVSQVFHRGDLEATLESIHAKVLLMPSKTDPLFKVCDLDKCNVSFLMRRM